MAGVAARRRARWLAPGQLALALLLLAAHALTVSAGGAVTDAEYRTITKGVTDLKRSSWFGSYDLMFGGARAIALDTDGRPIVVGTKLLSGRVLHFGSDGLSDQGFAWECCSGSGLGKLVVNSAIWVGQTGFQPKRVLRIAGSTNYVTSTVVKKIVKEAGGLFYSVGTVRPMNISSKTVDTYVVDGQETAVGDAAGRIGVYLATGGGMLIASHAFHWGSKFPLWAHPSNRVLNGMGIVLSGEPTQANAPVDPATPPPNTYNADVAAQCLLASCIGNTRSSCYTGHDGTIATYKARCMLIDDYMNELAGYRLLIRQLNRQIDSGAFQGPACSALRDLKAQISTPFKYPSPPPPPPPRVEPTTVPGLSYKLFYNARGFANFAAIKGRAVATGLLQSMNYYCGLSCISRTYKTNFAVRATGYIRVSKAVAAKPLKLSISASGLARVLINGREVTSMRILDGSANSIVTKTVTLRLKAGNANIVLEFIHRTGTSTLQLTWQPSGARSFSKPPLFFSSKPVSG